MSLSLSSSASLCICFPQCHSLPCQRGSSHVAPPLSYLTAWPVNTRASHSIVIVLGGQVLGTCSSEDQSPLPQSLVHHLHWPHRYDFHCSVQEKSRLPQEPCCSCQEDFSSGEKKNAPHSYFHSIFWPFCSNGVVFNHGLVFLRKQIIGRSPAQSMPDFQGPCSRWSLKMPPTVPADPSARGLCCFSRASRGGICFSCPCVWWPFDLL